MLSLVRSRLRAHRLLAAAAMLTVLLTTSVLTSLAAFAATTGDEGLQAALERRSAARTLVEAQSSVSAQNRERVDRSARAALHKAFDGLPTAVDAVTRSGTYALPGSGTAGRPEGAEGAEADLTLFASLDRKRVRVTAGHWPTGGARPAAADGVRVPVAVPVLVADRLGLAPGDVLPLTSTLDSQPVRAEIAGVFVPADAGDPYWRLDPLGGDGVRTSSFTTYGPLAVTEKAFAANGLAPESTGWQADADFSRLTTDRVASLRAHVAQAVADFAERSGIEDAEASSELPGLLDDLQRSLLVNRSTLLVAGLQLAVVAALTLILVSRLLVAERTAETELLRARGGARPRIAALAAVEAVLLSLPGLILAPLLAMPVVDALTGGGPAGSGDVPNELPDVVWWVAAATTLACALTVALPSLFAPARTTVVSRRRPASALMRGGADVALLLVAGVALWQLAGRSAGNGVLSGNTDGPGAAGLGIDPVLVTAPALALLAVTVPALRLLPLVVRAGERRAARGRGLTAALAGWQLSRRPARGTGPALLLVLAIAMGVFAVGQSASWDRSQADQAAFRTGADIVVRESTAPPFGQGGLLDGVEGVTSVAPVARDAFTVGGDSTTRVLATDTAAASGLLHLRGDLADEPVASLLSPLAARSGAATGVELPGNTSELRLRLRLRPAGGTEGVDTDVFVVVEDRYGVPYRFVAGELPADGRPHTLDVGLAEAAGGAAGSPAGPLRLTGLIVTYTAPVVSVEQRLTLERWVSVGPDGALRPVVPEDGLEWSPRIRATDTRGRLGLQGHDKPEMRAVRALSDGTAGPEGDAGPVLSARYTTGSAEDAAGAPDIPVEVSLWPGAGEEDTDGPLPAVATDAFLSATGSTVGQTVQARIGGVQLPLHITGSLRALPTTGGDEADGDGGAVLLDLAALDARLQASGGDPLEPGEWWLAAASGESGQVAGRLRERASSASVVTREGLTARLRSDPLGSGPRSALTGTAVAAAVLAATGFAVSTAGAARERRAEFAVLRALGASRRRLAQVPAAEQSVLVLLSLAVGLGLGILLARLVVPLIVLTSQATTPVPALLVELPAGRLTLLVGAIVAAPLLVIAATAARGTDPATVLRSERGD